MQSTLKEEIIELLNTMLDSIRILEERNKNVQSVNDFLSTPWGMTLLDANLMRIQFIGETASAIDKKTDKSLFIDYPNIPWKQIYSMRNFISHQYADIDPEMILVTLKKHIPPLKLTIKQIINDLSASGNNKI
ncbi:MAG TPA: antitoxin [Porphyromonadaceae bacterium]|jgi:uncharacterized protein with HEPN domain|nr:antitoxin [Porphyromonadaceae bacterium]HBK33351.1 antitoxin [Porphyromonadaceae bacterium]HBL34533.1 antitoxin [Porphyromonadaceae bacterium]HBX21645.1 antitoxin [Porphyromonadaceae bacterium]HCM19701.1 antitoxin [Porphyromonadaceae bacterium]